MRALSLAFVLALGCGGTKPECDTDCADADADADADTDADSDADADTDVVVEDCGDGIDNDGDGLLDCEDGDCATDPLCAGETICDDTLDNDNDGRADCMDEDCWGNGCAVSQATLNNADMIWARVGYFSQRAYGSPACASQTSQQQLALGIIAAAGTVRHMPASTPVWSTCTWTVGLSSWDAMPYAGAGQSVTRSGFAVQPGCALTTSGFLPQYMTFGYGATSSAIDIVTRPTGNGPKWVGFALYPNNFNYYSTSYVIPGSPCDIRVSSSSVYQQFPNANGGVNYTLTTP